MARAARPRRPGGVRKGMTAGVLRGNRYTPIPWDRHIATAIW